MAIVEDPQGTASLIGRVRAILLRPRETWEEIDGEPATASGLLKNYVAPLAAIGAVCEAVGKLAFGHRGALGFAYRAPAAEIVGHAFVGWVLDVAMVYVFALIIEAMSPQFGGVKDRGQALKLAAYTGTAAWLAKAFQIFPPLGVLSILGLYSFYLLFLGLPRLMKVEGDKATLFAICAIIAGMGVFFLASIATGIVTAPLFFISRFAL
jgi:hypothetical protein